jgi:hypothetical protein
VLVLVDDLNRAVIKTVGYARTLAPSVTAVHVSDDLDEGRRLRGRWEEAVLDIPLVLIHSPYRSFVAPVLAYLDALDSSAPGEVYTTIVLAECQPAWPWQRWLHNQTAHRLREALFERGNTALVQVPYSLNGASDGPPT